MDKKRKIILIILGIVVLIWVVVAITSPDPLETPYKPIEMSFLEQPDSSAKSEDKTHKEYKLSIIVDASVSMKGYIVPPSNSLAHAAFRPNFTPRISNLITNWEKDTTQKALWKCGARSNKWTDGFNEQALSKIMENASESTTKISDYLDSTVNEVNDSTIGVFVSDMVFSLSGRKTTTLSNSEISSIKHVVSKLNKNEILIVKYSAPFNGYFYYDNNNGKPFKNSVLQERPFYMVFIGKKELLSIVMENLETPERMWTTWGFGELTESREIGKECVQILSTPKVWTIPPIVNNDAKEEFTLLAEGDYKEKKSEVQIEFKDSIWKPIFLEDWQPKIEPDVATVERVNGENKIKITFKEFNSLNSEETVKISLVCNRYEYKDCNIDDDTNVTLDSIKNKTLGFEIFLKGIMSDKELKIKNDPVTVGELTFKLKKY